MRYFTKLTGYLLAVIVMSALQAQASIVYYSFTSNTLFNGTAAWTNTLETANIGSSISTFTINTLGASGAVTLPGGNLPQPDKVTLGYVAGNSVSYNNWAAGSSTSKYFQVTLDATGYSSILLSYDLQRSAGGPKTNSVWLSLDGGATFTSYNQTFLSLASAYGTFTNDLSALTGGGVDNNANVQIRFYPYLSNAGGTLRIDNITIDATVIPEPSTVLLAGAGLVGLLALRRRRS